MGVSSLLDPAGFLGAGSFPFCATATAELTIRAAPDLRFGTGSPWKAPARSGLVISVLFYPIPLGLPLYGRRIRVLHFEPIGGTPGTVDGILALRDYAFEAELAGVGEDGRAVAFHVFVE